MKILHTSDWHLGHMLYNDSQESAQQDMLHQIVDIVRAEQPDVLLIAGDIYDTTQPSASVQQMLANALVEMRHACEEMTIVCIAGNHDSGSRHMIFHTPWRDLNVHMIGSIFKDSPLDDYIIPVKDKGYVVAVPFAVDRFMPDHVFNALGDKVKTLNTRNLPVVLCAHLAIAQSDWRGHDFSSDTNIGGLNCQQPDIFGADYDYIALGHIHKQQHLAADKRIWYAGTPIAVSFDESYPGNEHGVLLAECAAHGEEVSVTPLTITNLHPLVNLPSEGAADWETVKQQLADYDPDIASFVRLNVEVDDYLPVGANEEARDILTGKQCRLSVINSQRKPRVDTGHDPKTFTATELQQIDFINVARLFIEQEGEVFTDEMQEMLEEVRKQLNTHTD